MEKKKEKKYLILDGKQTRIEDLTGKKFGRLTVVRFDEIRFKESLDLYKITNDTHSLKHCWLCSCSCENNELISVTRANLIKGKTKSCGCYKKELSIKRGILDITKSFEDWCIENNCMEYLKLWDYDLNFIEPSAIGFGSEQSIYFKCPNNIHDSELKKIINLTRNNAYSCICSKCNSFAHWGEINLCSDFLEKYWDYDKNVINPCEISKATHKKVWIKCQEKDYHGSYEIQCNNFKNGKRCSFCNTIYKVHIEDSLGKYLQDNDMLYMWSNKNKKSPFEISLHSNKKHWFKCKNNIHNDFFRTVNNSINFDFRCPECSYSKGENKISEFLIQNKINYISQYSFEELVGLGNGLLTYDFYLKDYNLLIEYQGEQHYKYVAGLQLKYENFEKQQEHDSRKRQYAIDNNIKLLEIPYWDFDNVDEILKKELNII